MKKNPPEENDETTPPADPELGDGSFGSWLRRQREVRDITLREIADESRISLRYLQALEEDRFEILPAPVFAKGFLRQYASYVGLDPEDVVNYYLSVRGLGQVDEEPQAEARPAAPSRSSFPWGVALVAAIAAALVVWGLFAFLGDGTAAEPGAAVGPEVPIPGASGEPRPSPGPAEPEPAGPGASAEASGEEGSTPSAAPPRSAAPLEVILQFDGECWVEALIDQQETLSELRVQGEALQLAAREEVRLTLGDPTVVRIEVNGHPFEFASEPGSVLRNLKIDLETARRLAQRAP